MREATQNVYEHVPSDLPVKLYGSLRRDKELGPPPKM